MWSSGRGSSTITSSFAATLGCPVFLIAWFLRVGLDGSGWDVHEEHFWEQRVLRFEYAYVGLPAVPGEAHAMGENLLGEAPTP